MDILGIIPARGGSKGVPRKNLRLLAGRPLIAYTIEAASSSNLLRDFLVSTDDGEIAEVAQTLGAKVLQRPPELAQDDTPMAPVLEHAVRWYAEQEGELPEVAVILQPTAPLRRSAHIDACLQLLLDCDAGSVVSVSPVPGHFHPAWQYTVTPEGELRMFTGEALAQIPTSRQDLSMTYSRNGAMYAFRTAGFLEGHTFYVPPCLAYRMKAEESVNIDSEDDFWLAEKYIQSRPHDS
jgi:CMP-N,N'-diacetyllegionaminic acid synthase